MNELLIWSLASALVSSSLATLLCHWQERRAWNRWESVWERVLFQTVQAAGASSVPSPEGTTYRQNRCLR